MERLYNMYDFYIIFQPSLLIKNRESIGCEVHGGKRVRTADLCNAIAALYQLSYTPLSCVFDSILIIGTLSR